MNATNTVNICLRVFDSKSKKYSQFQLKDVPYFESVLGLKQHIAGNYQDETGVKTRRLKLATLLEILFF